MAKHTFEYVKNYINEKSNGECELLSTEYVNSNTPLALKCKCGNVFYKSFYDLRNGFFLCKDCLNKYRSEKYRANIDDIIKYINDSGCEYISGEYKNTKSVLTIKCRCGNLFEKDFNHFKRGQTRCTKCGAESSRQSKFKYDLESVKDILSKRGYTLLENEYINCQTPLKCRCSRGHTTNIVFNQFLAGCSGCKICAYINQSGENSNLYKGGESEVLDDLRKSLKEWKLKILKKYNYECLLTNSKKDLVVHHLKSFRTIFLESCEELNLPVHKKIKDYELGKYKQLKDLIHSKHTLEEGVVLQRKVHQKFHAIYGVFDNTEEQFKEFIQNHYPKKLNDYCEKD